MTIATRTAAATAAALFIIPLVPGAAAAGADQDVVMGNVRTCRAQLARDGVSSTLSDVGDVGHPDSGRRGPAGALRWFEPIAPAVPYGR